MSKAETPTKEPGWHQADLHMPNGAQAPAYCHGPHPDQPAARKAAQVVVGDKEYALVPDDDGGIWIIPH